MTSCSVFRPSRSGRLLPYAGAFHNSRSTQENIPVISGGYRFSFPPSPKIFGLPAKRFPPRRAPLKYWAETISPPPARAPLAAPLNPPLPVIADPCFNTYICKTSGPMWDASLLASARSAPQQFDPGRFRPEQFELQRVSRLEEYPRAF